MNGAYYYHSDHLGSAQVVTNHAGAIYERFEYTPYGEVWIAWANSGVVHNEMLPYRFTGKELDEETGLYYYGARYLDPKVSRWLSADPAMGEYIPSAPVNDEARRRNGNLPGMGGVFNYVNLHAYHYAGNNPVKYIDPDGEEGVAATLLWDAFWGNGEHQDYSQNLDFLHTFLFSPTMNNTINNSLQAFKNSAISQNTFEGSISFYGDLADFDLMLGVGLGEYSVTITEETKSRGLFKKTEVTVYHIEVTINDTYDFNGYRDDDSLGSKLNNWGYDKQKEGDIKPYTWSFTYSFDRE
jgi:RHS repeat-associated protein